MVDTGWQQHAQSIHCLAAKTDLQTRGFDLKLGATERNISFMIFRLAHFIHPNIV